MNLSEQLMLGKTELCFRLIFVFIHDYCYNARWGLIEFGQSRCSFKSKSLSIISNGNTTRLHRKHIQFDMN